MSLEDLTDKMTQAIQATTRHLRRGTNFKSGDVVRHTKTGAFYTFKAYHPDTYRTGLVDVQRRPGGTLTIPLKTLELRRRTR